VEKVQPSMWATLQRTKLSEQVGREDEKRHGAENLLFHVQITHGCEKWQQAWFDNTIRQLPLEEPTGEVTIIVEPRDQKDVEKFPVRHTTASYRVLTSTLPP
jgi:hypothetical protein